METDDFKILAIDDNRDNLMVLKAILLDRLPEYRLLTALDGPTGIELALAEDPVVILLDIVMPGMDGFAVCRTLKNDERLQTIPVLFLTALRTERDCRFKALEVGADGFLTKPIDEIELIAQIRTMVKIKAANLRQRLEKEYLAALVAKRTQELEQELAKRMRVEEALRESEEKYRVFFESSRDAIMTLEPPSWRFTSGNSACVNLYGANDEIEFISCGPWDLSPDFQPDGRPSVEKSKDMIDKAVREGSHFFEWMHRRIGGEEFPADVLLTRMEHRGKMILQASVRDITERRKLESELIQLQKMEAVGQLAGGVAHDFNNIMQVIMGNAQLQSIFNIQRGLDCRYVEEIFQAVERGASLTRSLLVFSREQPLELTSFDLNGLIRESHKLAMRLVTEDISINLELDKQVLRVKGDAGLVQHVVFNLVTNARDAISRQGSIIISSRGIDIDGNFIAMHGGTSPEGHYALLTVKDTGCGISDEIKARIFEPFFTTKEAGKGTGLGLAMIYGTIRQMGGFIVVNSHLGAGTAFEIYIPLTDENREVAEASDDIDNKSGNGELLLIVEDEKGVRDSLSHILTISGYRVICAASGEEAIELATDNSSEMMLVIMDMILPGINGIEIALELHQIRPELPVLFLSGYSDETLESKGIKGYHLQKPVRPAQLLEHIHRMLNELQSA
jgi:PAS domain S-box-containing protein